MNIGNLPDNKLVSLALNGYNSFQPDVGIFCGGYQGPLYPNPTTLSYPGFDPYTYVDAVPSTYLMTNAYTGLGVGNPGIDYKNPGHILGLLDTFLRMSYGMGVLQAVHDGLDVESVSPLVDIAIPIDDGTIGGTSLGSASIYPFFSEIPTDWTDGFTIDVDGTVSPDPRTFVSFPSPGGGHTPSTNPIDEQAFNDLFANKTIFSYFGMPQYLRAAIASLYSAGAGLLTKAEHQFSLDDFEYFNTYGHLGAFFANPPSEFDEALSLGTYYSQCAVNTAAEALSTFTGSPVYHNGAGDQNEYRSLTELNSVVNIVPVQMVGATFWTDINGHSTINGNPVSYTRGGRGVNAASYMIADFVINVSDIPVDPDNPEPGTITVAGTATVNSLITDASQYYYTETRRNLPVPITNPPGDIVTTTYGSDETIRKDISIAMSSTNGFSWDKVWLDGSEVADSGSFSDSVDLDNLGGGNDQDPGGIITLDQSPLVVPFTKTFTLGAGCTSVRMRLFARNRHTLGQVHFSEPDSWVPVEFCHYHPFIIVFPDFHCHYPVGVHEGDWTNDPDSVTTDLAATNIELSLTVTGTSISPMTYEVSI